MDSFHHILKKMKLGIGWYDCTDNIQDDFAKKIAMNMTSYWTGESSVFWQLQSFCSNDIDDLMRKAAAKDLDWLLICATGLMLSAENNLPKEISKLAVNLDNVAFMGHVLDFGDRYYSLHHQTILLKLRWYRNSGYPEFGKKEDVKWTAKEPIRSTENFHDGYTPTWVKSGSVVRQYNGRQQGWNLIKTALDGGYETLVFDQRLRNSKIYHYFEVKDEWQAKMGRIWNELQTDIHFLANTENPIEVPRHHAGTFDVCMMPAGGLNTILIPWYLRMKPHSKVVVFDASPIAIDMSEKIRKNYRGGDLEEFFSANCLIPRSSSHYRRYYRAGDNIPWMKDVFDKELNNGLGEWLAEVYPTINYRFECINILDENNWWIFNNQPGTPRRKIYLNMSNIFHYLPTALFFSTKDRINIHNRMISKLSNRSDDWYMQYLNPSMGSFSFSKPIECTIHDVDERMKILPWER